MTWPPCFPVAPWAGWCRCSMSFHSACPYPRLSPLAYCHLLCPQSRQSQWGSQPANQCIFIANLTHVLHGKCEFEASLLPLGSPLQHNQPSQSRSQYQTPARRPRLVTRKRADFLETGVNINKLWYSLNLVCTHLNAIHPVWLWLYHNIICITALSLYHTFISCRSLMIYWIET